MRALALDFDGVISDSAPESFWVALRSYVDLRPGSALADDAAALEGPGAPQLSRVRAARLYVPFLELMPLGNRAEDYAVVLAALEEQRPLPDQEAYDAFRDARHARDPGFRERYHRHFYAVRSALAERDPQGWRGLMAPYAELLEALRRRADELQLAIATAKDRASVQALLALYGIEDLFPPERLLDKETGVGKQAHLGVLRERLGIGFEEITFVDDKLNHLDAVAALGVRCVLAAWGYNGPREERLARLRGHAVARLDALDPVFGGPPAPI